MYIFYLFTENIFGATVYAILFCFGLVVFAFALIIISKTLKLERAIRVAKTSLWRNAVSDDGSVVHC